MQKIPVTINGEQWTFVLDHGWSLETPEGRRVPTMDYLTLEETQKLMAEARNAPETETATIESSAHK